MIYLYYYIKISLGELDVNSKSKNLFLPLLVALILVILEGCSSAPNKNINISVPVKNETSQITNNSSSPSYQGNNYPVIDQSTLSSSSTIVLKKALKTNLFAISVPESWTAANEGNSISPMNQYILFNKISDDIYGGGVMRQEWNALPGESNPKLSMFLMWLLPNNASAAETVQLTGFFTDTYLMKVDKDMPATSGKTNVSHWTYIIFIDKNNSTPTKFVAYELFFNNDLASEADAVKIAESFKLM
jgi:hypothetical protein